MRSEETDDLRRSEPSDPAVWKPEPAFVETPTQRSLFGEILDWMLVPLLLLWPISIAITYLAAKSIANQPFDRALEDKVTVVAQQFREINGAIVGNLPGSARDILRADDIDNVYFQVTGPDNELIDGDADIPTPADEDKPKPWTILFRSATIHNTEVLIAYTYIDLRRRGLAPGKPDSARPTSRMALVQVAETLEKRSQLANQIIKSVILPEFIILPIALALVWFALARGLAPLAHLQERIRARRPDDLSPIDSGQVPEEISPLVRSLNDMLARLSQTIKTQKRFIADAAHQMKTPLAGMRMQAELALRQTTEIEIHRSLEQLAKSSTAATRLINQLLALARAENQTPEAAPTALLDLSALAREVLQEWVQPSFTLGIDLGLELLHQPGLADDPLMVEGNSTMLRELFNNLIDNALRYTPRGGSVTVRLHADAPRAWATIEVEDTGPGIAISERSHVFDRFYRILGSNTEGSGLGLAIVREIAQQHGAEVNILDNAHAHDPRYPGCVFRIVLRMAPMTLPSDGMI